MISNIEKINVFLASEVEILVGQLSQENGKTYFKYNEGFIQNGFNISPFKLKFDTSIQTNSDQLFDGLFGVFDDSLPDGWGRLLMDRYLKEKGTNPYDINPLTKLALIGSSGFGALIYKPELEARDDIFQIIDLEEINKKVVNIYEDYSIEDISEIYRLGGSSGGARPKVNLFLDSKSDRLYSKNSDAKDILEPWIIKFPSSNDQKDMAKVEYAYSLMAKAAGIRVSDTKLFQDSKGASYFGTKRFDLGDSSRLHMISAAGLMHDNYRMSNIDYGHLADAALRLTNGYNSVVDVIRIAIFNVLAHNKDDHSKNFAYLADKDGGWQFSPAYDLTFSDTPFGHHSITISGKSKKPTYKDFVKLATNFGINNLKEIVEEVSEAISHWKKVANSLDMNKEVVKEIGITLSSVRKDF